MIPKIIHYCWFGGNPKPEVIEKCMATWKRYCPEWEIKEWNESNYDITAHPYTKEAYEAKKWAFVSDVARLEIVSTHGGIYLDTDVEILSPNPFDEILDYVDLLVFETERSINTGLCMGGEVGSELCQKLLAPYLEAHYSEEREVVNSMMNKPIFREKYPDLKWDGQSQRHGGTYIMGISEYGAKMKHYGTRSWCDDLPRYKISGFWGLKKILRNPHAFELMQGNGILRKLVPIYEFAVYDFLDLGPVYYAKRLMLKMRKK